MSMQTKAGESSDLTATRALAFTSFRLYFVLRFRGSGARHERQASRTSAQNARENALDLCWSYTTRCSGLSRGQISRKYGYDELLTSECPCIMGASRYDQVPALKINGRPRPIYRKQIRSINMNAHMMTQAM